MGKILIIQAYKILSLSIFKNLEHEIIIIIIFVVNTKNNQEIRPRIKMLENEGKLRIKKQSWAESRLTPIRILTVACSYPTFCVLKSRGREAAIVRDKVRDRKGGENKRRKNQDKLRRNSNKKM